MKIFRFKKEVVYSNDKSSASPCLLVHQPCVRLFRHFILIVYFIEFSLSSPPLIMVKSWGTKTLISDHCTKKKTKRTMVAVSKFPTAKLFGPNRSTIIRYCKIKKWINSCVHRFIYGYITWKRYPGKDYGTLCIVHIVIQSSRSVLIAMNRPKQMAYFAMSFSP